MSFNWASIPIVLGFGNNSGKLLLILLNRSFRLKLRSSYIRSAQKTWALFFGGGTELRPSSSNYMKSLLNVRYHLLMNNL